MPELSKTILSNNQSLELNNSQLTTTSLKAYYKFESGALTTDSSGNSHTLTAISDPALGTGKLGGCIDLDGDDAYSAVDHADFKPTGAFSISLWLKGASDNSGVFQSYSRNTAFAGINIWRGSGGKIQLEIGSNTGITENTHWKKLISNASNLGDNNWHHFVATWDTATMRLYIDGSLDNSVACTLAPAYAATNHVRIGCTNTTGSNASFYTGSIDDLGLYHSVLDETTIKRIYGSGLVAYYKMEAGALVTDSSGNSRTLTNNNTVGELVGGKFGGAADNGTASNKYLSIADTMDISGASSISVSMWVKLNAEISSGTYLFFTHRSTNTADRYFQLQYEYNGGTRRIMVIPSSVSSIAFNTSMGTSNWHHLVAVRDSVAGQSSLYVNGAYIGSVANGSITDGSNYVRIGGDGTNGAQCAIDDVAIFNRVITIEEIKELYEGRYIGEYKTTSTIKAHYRMNGLADSSTNAYHLTNNNSVAFNQGKFGLCADFGSGNTNKSLQSTSFPNFASGDAFTLICWVNNYSNPGNNTDFGYISRQDGGTRNFEFGYHNQSGTLKIVFSNQTGGSDTLLTKTLSTGVWYMLAATHSSSTNKIYINGYLEMTNSSANANGNPTSRLVIGGKWNGSAIVSVASSKIDEVIIDSRAWTDAEIRKYYASCVGKFQ